MALWFFSRKFPYLFRDEKFVKISPRGEAELRFSSRKTQCWLTEQSKRCRRITRYICGTYFGPELYRVDPTINSAVTGHLMPGTLSEKCVISDPDITEARAHMRRARHTRAVWWSPSLLGYLPGKHVSIKHKRKTEPPRDAANTGPDE